jgi:hypothetical protein
MTVNSRVIQTFLQWSPNAIDVPLLNGLRVQILPTMEDLPRARKNQFAAFVMQEGLLVVWDDDALHLVERAKAIELELMELVWNSGNIDIEEGEKKLPNMEGFVINEESGEITGPPRPLHMQNTVMVACTIVLIMATLGAGARELAAETAVDYQYLRIILLFLAPIQVFFTLFFAQVIVGCLAQLFGPVKQLTTNSKFYSATPPPRLQGAILPHITIQCPVYKEGLRSVIVPTVKSIKQAMSTYELQGGSANLFINDDGIQGMDEDERRARIEFYADHSIGWTARPPNGDNGFVRKGKFKKASNMNYGLNLSCLVEDKLTLLQRPHDWTQADEAQAYERCLKEVLEGNGRAWADGNIRVGDYILLSRFAKTPPKSCVFLSCIHSISESLHH